MSGIFLQFCVVVFLVLCEVVARQLSVKITELSLWIMKYIPFCLKFDCREREGEQTKSD